MSMSSVGSDEYDKIQLVTRAAEGDTLAQEHLVALLRRRVRTIARAILGHAEDAEDATQNALLEILAAAPSYRGGSLLAWADRIAARTAARHARKRRVRAAHEVSDSEPDAYAPKFHSARLEDAIPRPLLRYLEELPETRRTALVLRHVLEYSIAEIAELTETSPNTVKDRLLAARAHIRRTVRREIGLGSLRERELGK
jgi:RNA polymerase sigma-70 factor, ECF subfamily